MNTAQIILLAVAFTCYMIGAVVAAVYILRFKPEPEHHETGNDEWNPC